MTKKFTLLVSCFGLLVSGVWFSAYAENPWQQRYEERAAEVPEVVSSPEEEHHITYGQAREAIARALEQRQAGENIRVTLPRRDEETIVSSSAPIAAEVGEVSYDAKSHTWKATVYFTADSRPLAPANLSGRFEDIMTIPMLRHRVGSGETITEEDIEMRPYAEQRIQKDTVTDIAQIVGKAPKRTISSGRPIRVGEVVNPPVVNKGDTITLVYKTPAMEIRTLGEALENGAEGSVIRIRNRDSHVVIQASVIGKGIAHAVSLTSAPTLLSSRNVP